MMFIRRAIVLMPVLPVAAFLLLACGGPPDASGVGAPAAAAAKASEARQAQKQNACALVNREEIERIAGKKILMLHNIEDTDQTTCELYDDATKQALVYVKVYWKGGKEMVRAEQAAMSMAKQMLNSPDTDIAELTGSGTVKGLADEAFYSDVMPSWVLKGDVLVQVISPLWGHDQTLKTFNTVAKSALPRL
jgi:hypothetical protein